jgi:hypothetical protein
MKYKITQSKLHSAALRFLLSELGEFKYDEKSGIQTFVKHNRENAVLMYYPKEDGYYVSLDDSIYDTVQDMFSLDNEDMYDIVGKLVYDLTGSPVVRFSTFDKSPNID